MSKHLVSYVSIMDMDTGNHHSIPIGYTKDQIKREYGAAVLDQIGEHCWVEDEPESKDASDISGMKVRELAELAQQKGVDLTGLSRKEDIIEAIENNRGVIDDIAED